LGLGRALRDPADPHPVYYPRRRWPASACGLTQIQAGHPGARSATAVKAPGKSGLSHPARRPTDARQDPHIRPTSILRSNRAWLEDWWPDLVPVGSAGAPAIHVRLKLLVAARCDRAHVQWPVERIGGF